MCAAKEISVDAATELDAIFTFEEEHRMALEAFLGG